MRLARDWEGQPVFILAGGPSVLGHDLSMLEGYRVIAINSAHLTYPAADVLYYTDDDWWTSVGSKEPPFAGEIVTPAGIGPKVCTRLIRASPDKGFSSDSERVAVSATSVSGALHVAIHRGGHPVFVLGVDGKVGADGRRHHHNGRYKNPLRHGWAKRHNAELERLAMSIRSLGIDVYNCSPVSDLSCWPKLDFEEAVSMAHAALMKAAPSPAKFPLAVMSMYGAGDCIHQRAVLRELMKTNDVELQTFYTAMYHDLEAEGLRVTLINRPNLPPRMRDRGNQNQSGSTKLNTAQMKIGYDHAQTRRHGTLLNAMFGSVGLKIPERPDFSMPVKQEWRNEAKALIGDTGGKPVMIYRPIVVNATWLAPARSPDPAAYAALYRSIKDRFFTVSVCDLTQKGEEIVGEEQDADLKLHRGEADFETLAGLFAEAALVFGNAGFTPILAQAVGTPNICVYGGNESFRFTNICGAHLAPTLPIEPVKPCECFDRHHKCDKTIDLAKAVPLVEAFAIEHGATPRILVFGTTYVDSEEKQRLAGRWEALHRKVNGWAVDLLLVDSASPVPLLAVEEGAEKYAFPDNIGHLARGGKDGWGRAFCKGLEMAIDGQYDYVVHIEGDSLFSKPVLPIIRKMMADGVKAATVPVEGTKRQETGWAETGLMFFSVDYLWQSKFIERYDWWNRKARPFPEQAVFDLIGGDLHMLPLKAERGDRGQITAENAAELDWITHCPPEALDAFVTSIISPLEGEMGGSPEGGAVPPTSPSEAPLSALPGISPSRGEIGQTSLVKLNFGCGTNRLDGWQNYDAEIDITKRLPFPDSHADFIYAEHVVEHVDYRAALKFFAECRRVLKPGGVIRIAVPSLENIYRRGDQAYFDFTRKWGPSADLRGAMHAIIFAHGHQAIWSQGLLEACLYFAGFEDVVPAEQHCSSHAALTGVEGHHRVIGDKFNWIESAIAEGRK
ncbi:MAG: methyltransferase domain-containing protein [Mesorhizobium sp.]|uniref:methyltransferase domain-containing protein n=1 Tax=Mesorhizobium sp. M7A.F.Ca.ET.027.02.1.1 TaxID=2496655 RepID=UPI000FD1E200|nr:methyltransferase domain-containing protein [Mesorhizobium sp. M7A.F.Ca.ET.027.02.1.1]RVD14303.1 methyltransferase domain-containing protein [Mesorhizobium sp. M7A.F.Ca.ET.027.02.1.1]RWC98982.1 MAG: methyltransferase domain-containing protein [Mesorhizobium sp.]